MLELASLVAAGAPLAGRGRRLPGELPVPTPAPGAVRDAAGEILRDAKYRASGPSVLERVLHWLGARLDALLPDQVGGSGGPGAVVVWLLVIVVLVLAVRAVVRSGWRPTLRGRRRRAAPAGERHEFDVRAHHDAGAWRAAAEAFEARGAWREAVHARYGELVAELVDRQLLVDLPGRTSGEHRAELAAVAPALAEPFGVATDVFERAWYTDAPAGAHDVAAIRAAAGAVLGAAVRT
jgi:hypothetical protein